MRPIFLLLLLLGARAQGQRIITSTGPPDLTNVVSTEPVAPTNQFQNATQFQRPFALQEPLPFSFDPTLVPQIVLPSFQPPLNPAVPFGLNPVSPQTPVTPPTFIQPFFLTPQPVAPAPLPPPAPAGSAEPANP